MGFKGRRGQVINKLRKIFKSDDETQDLQNEVETQQVENTSGGSSGGTASDISLSQATKLGVTAGKTIELEIDKTEDFNKMPIEVLKFVPGQDNVISTLIEFNNADEYDFEPQTYVGFDTTMHLKTNYTRDMNDDGLLLDYTVDATNGVITFDNPKENSETGEALTNTGDDLTFEFSNKSIKSGSVVVYEDGTDIASDISSTDLQNGTVTFTNTHTGSVTADYTWISEVTVDYKYQSSENPITGESLTTEDDLTFEFVNDDIKDGTIVVYEKVDITDDITDKDLTNSSVTFLNTHTGEVTADYTYNSGTEVAGEVLTNTGDDLTFTFANTPLDDGSITVYEKKEITSKIDSKDLVTGSVTFSNEHTGVVSADYTYFGHTQVIEEVPTTSDNQIYQLANYPIKESSVVAYENGESVTGRMWSRTIDLTEFKSIDSIEVV